jgi:hypothetical protein
MEAELPKPLGLDRLSPTAISLLREFVDFNATADLREGFSEELHLLADHDLEGARITFEALARSENLDDRIALCYDIPYVAERHPDLGFPLWCQLMGDSSVEVWDAASEALADNLGELDLDPEGVVEVVDAHFQAQRRHTELRGSW